MTGSFCTPAQFMASWKSPRDAVLASTRTYVREQEPRFAAGLAAVDLLQLSDISYRACVPGNDPRRWLCLIVDTDQSPPGIVRDGEVVVRPVMELTLTCDHRILYGADAAQFLGRIRERLENPLSLAL